jgi:cell division protein FtsI (penicillin-binding protein 3)
MTSSSPPAAASVARRRILLLGWLVAGLFLLGKSGELQILQAGEWRAEADRQHRAQGVVAAARGGILDRSGMPLALSHEAFRIGIAPHELTDPAESAALLIEALDLTPNEARRVTTSDRRWIQLPTRYPPSAREALSGARGIYVERELRRFYPQDQLARGLLGALLDEKGSGGIEQRFEDHLHGTPGTRMRTRDSSGQPIPGESWIVNAPISGGDVVLTLDLDLQEIAHEALEAAVAETGARGGDLLVTDPRTGEILAMVSMRDGSTNHLGAINTPSEPGSTLKPFTVAALLERDRAALTDSVDTGMGHWTTHGRTIRDVSVVGNVTLSHALRVSSNVGIAKVAERLTPEEQYENLRDFGFGVPAGIHLPGEASGSLSHPSRWSRQSAASLAIGYEISATPLQLAMAYGALANGGRLMEPRLVRELRAPDGRVIERFEPRMVRQVVREDVAAEINRALAEAVSDGTGGRAQLQTFAVAGKSGTARATGEGGAYEVGAYHASFVGFFPAEDPQLVVFVKLERPQGAYYGGVTAAPVTRATMEAVLAARHPPLDRNALAAIARSQDAAFTAAGRDAGNRARPALFTSISPVDDAPARAMIPSEGHENAMALPDIRGLSPRTAIRRLHALGLTVAWDGTGEIIGTVPRHGSAVTAGDTVTIRAETRSTAPPGGAPVTTGGL